MTNRRTTAAFLACAAIAIGLPTTAAANTPPAIGGGVVAASRCTSRVINDYVNQIRDDDKRPPKDDAASLNERLAKIGELLSGLGEERNILDSICTTDADKAPLFAQINAATAWGLLLQSDIAGKLNASCPAAAVALPSAMVAQAWLALAASVNDAGGTVTGSVAEVVPKVRQRAAALNLTLPAYPDASAYWRDQVAEKARDSVKNCPGAASPVPTATP